MLASLERCVIEESEMVGSKARVHLHRILLADEVAMFYQRHDRHLLLELDEAKWQAIFSDTASWQREMRAQYTDVCVPELSSVSVSQTYVQDNRPVESNGLQHTAEQELEPAEVRAAVQKALYAPAANQDLPISEALVALQNCFALQQLPPTTREEYVELEYKCSTTLRGLCWKVMLGDGIKGLEGSAQRGLSADMYIKTVEGIDDRLPVYTEIAEDVASLGASSADTARLARVIAAVVCLAADAFILRQGVAEPVAVDSQGVYTKGMAAGTHDVYEHGVRARGRGTKGRSGRWDFDVVTTKGDFCSRAHVPWGGRTWWERLRA